MVFEVGVSGSEMEVTAWVRRWNAHVDSEILFYFFPPVEAVVYWLQFGHVVDCEWVAADRVELFCVCRICTLNVLSRWEMR